MAQSIGIVGCGAIGKALLQAVDSGKLSVPVSGVSSRNEHRAREFLGSLDSPLPYLDRRELIEKADLVTEMRKVKHHFDQGIRARIGIEF